MRTSRDGSLELFGDDYRRRVEHFRKPPRPHGRRRKLCGGKARRSGGNLTTFQKLDREMGRFVNAQKGLEGARSNGFFSMHGSEEDSSVRGVRHGVKWKCGWMFEQDSLYWETVRRQNVSGGEEQDSWRERAYARLDAVKEKDAGSVTSRDSSSPLGYDGALRHHCSTDHESISSGMGLHLRPTRARAKKNGSRRDEMSVEVTRDAEKYPSRNQKSSTDRGRNGRADAKAKKDWPAFLRVKCEVLQMEKEFADQRLQQQTSEMAQAAEIAHYLRSTVQNILESAKRGTVSAPCTPGRHEAEDSPGLLQRIQRLQKFNVQSNLQDQAKDFQNRIENLRLKSQVRSAASSFRKDLNPKARVSSSPAVTSDGEEWAQVQEVLKLLRGKAESLQQSCENWEKRAFFAEAKAASLQIEEEKWRTEAQKAEEKVRDLERELVQVRAVLEEVRNRHALEQSRLLGSGNNHGYTVVLQPIVTSHGSANSKCAVSSNCEGNCYGSGLEHHQTDCDHQTEAVSMDRRIGSDEIRGHDELSSPNDVVAAPTTPSPYRGLSEASTQGSSRHRYEGLLEGDGDDTPIKIPKDSGQTNVHEIAKSEVQKSLSQKWFKQRPKSRRPTTPGCEVGISDARSNLGSSSIRGKVHAAGGSSGQNALRKPGPVLSGNTRAGSSGSLLEKRAPLKEIKRNTPSHTATKVEWS